MLDHARLSIRSPCAHTLSSFRAHGSHYQHDILYTPHSPYARLYSHPQPYGGHWGDARQVPGKDWRATATRVGNAILAICPRWLIMIEGVAYGSGECDEASGEHCWCGAPSSHRVHFCAPHKLYLYPDTMLIHCSAFTDCIHSLICIHLPVLVHSQ